MKNKTALTGKIVTLIICLLMVVALDLMYPLEKGPDYYYQSWAIDLTAYFTVILMLSCIVALVLFGLCNIYGIKKFGFTVYSCSMSLFAVIECAKLCYRIFQDLREPIDVLQQMVVTLGSIAIGIGSYLISMWVYGIIQKSSNKRKLGVTIVLILSLLMLAFLSTMFPLFVYVVKIDLLEVTLLIHPVTCLTLPGLVAMIIFYVSNACGVKKRFGFTLCSLSVMISSAISGAQAYNMFYNSGWGLGIVYFVLIMIGPMAVSTGIYLLTMLGHHIIKKSLEKSLEKNKAAVTVEE